MRALPADQDASKCYDPTAEEYYHGYGCTIVSTGSKIPIAAGFTGSKQAPRETAMRTTCDALAVAKPMWMVGDSAYDTLDWHNHLLTAGVVPVAPYNARNTEDPKDIKYRVEDRIEQHGDGEYADGDVHVNTCESHRPLARSWLSPHRGISKDKRTPHLRVFQLRRRVYRKPGKEALKGILKTAL